MYMILNDTLFEAHPVPVMPMQMRIEHDPEDNRLTLYSGPMKIEFGVVWHGYGCRVDGRSGKILAVTAKDARVRAVFGSKHLDFMLLA